MSREDAIKLLEQKWGRPLNEFEKLGHPTLLYLEIYGKLPLEEAA